MATWTSLVVLSLAVVSTLSFPRPDAEYNIPNVGLGSRAQYYVLHSDGTYKYGYDTGDGIFEQSMAQAPGEVTGAFGYKDATGADVKLEYTADSRGFIPTGSHLPVAPEVTLKTSGVHSVATAYSAPSVPTASVAIPAVPSAPVEIANIRSSAAGDGSYSFSYQTSGSSRNEAADTSNSVTGQYSFIADDGINREINYVAGSETGYIAEGDSLPVGPSVPGAESGIPTGRILPVLSEEEANALAAATSGVNSATTYSAQASSANVKSELSGSSDASYSFSYDADESTRSESADADLNIEGSYSFIPPEGHRLTVNYIAGSDTGFVATGDHLPVAPTADSGAAVVATSPSIATYSAPVASATPVVRSSDASYSFSYDAGESSRSENADANLNIQGAYSFVPPEGHRLTVNYIAGSDTGFVATGDHLPVAPSVDEHSAATYSAASSSSTSASSSGSNAVLSASVPIEIANIRSSANEDGSYSFSYDTSSSSRSESGNSDNSVTGYYGFVADDGINREIKYIAGAETGYIAEGDSLPVGPSVPGAESGIPTGRIFPILSEEEANALAAATSSSNRAVTYYADSSASSGSSSDASYSFNYDAGESTRQETADSNLNIQGSYSFVPPEGHKLTVNYIAGSDTGFVATGNHLPVAPEVSVAATSGASATAYSAPEPAVSAAATASVAAVTSTRDSSDASYSFSYDAGESTRAESADAELNVEGSYSFVPPEGHRLTVNYVAGSDTGFVATGDHLPVAPAADSSASVTGHSSTSGVATYSASAVASPSASVASSAPVEVAQVRGSTGQDGSYSFSYETSDSSRSESADAQNSVTGQYSFVADDGINREISYVAGSETGYIADGDSLPIGPSVPGAESGIPTGRILPVLSEEEANALAASSSSVGITPVLKAAASSNSPAVPVDASYSFSFKSDSYSRQEEADEDGNVAGSYTFVDEHGDAHTVNFVAGRETGFVPEGFPTPDTVSRAVAPVPVASVKTATASGSTSNTPVTYSAPSVKKAGVKLATKTASAGHRSQVIGDVLLHQYDGVNRDKYGYVFTALQR